VEERRPNRRLTAHDTVFLHWEHPEQPMHVAECLVYDGRFEAEELIEMLEERLHLLPRYRQKVVFPPLGVVHPTWEDDPHFDVRNHVDTAELPAPGDDRVLSQVGGRLFVELLERDRPLWKATVIHGHESGGTVVFLKLHHAMVDGVSSIDILEVLHGTVPNAPAPPPPTEDWRPKPIPGGAARLAEGLVDQASSLAGGVRNVAGALDPRGARQRVRQLRTVARTLVETTPMAVRRPPSTPFNRRISAAREFAWLELQFDDVQTTRKALGATVNDMVLTILSGALGRYMRRHGTPTDGVKLRVMCPVSMRRDDQHGALGNLVSMVVVGLDVDIEDPLERLQSVRAEMQRLKSVDQAGGLYDLMSVMNALPAPAFAATWKHAPRGYWPHNITSTNVAGPRTPLYLGPHELLHWYPVGVQWNDNGLFLCTLSYREYLVLGLVSDPNVVSDIWEANDDLRASYDEIAAAAVEQRPRARRTGRPKSKRPAA
jgi:WS/DGAT/MGAT family acyltransferase